MLLVPRVISDPTVCHARIGVGPPMGFVKKEHKDPDPVCVCVASLDGIVVLVTQGFMLWKTVAWPVPVPCAAHMAYACMKLALVIVLVPSGSVLNVTSLLPKLPLS